MENNVYLTNRETQYLMVIIDSMLENANCENPFRYNSNIILLRGLSVKLNGAIEKNRNENSCGKV